MRRVLVTGSAGFIGYHLCAHLLAEGFQVHGYDGLTDYYDVGLKRRRHAMLSRGNAFSATEALLEDASQLDAAADAFRPDIIVHLAAQAGVRYSLEQPRAYIDANLTGGFNVLETARRLEVKHLLMASTSSVYGANTSLPFRETDKADTQLTLYAATKKANEAMAHCYAHLWSLPVTLFRFFTVYGPWGRPDMAYYKFAEAILDGRPIELYNHGRMQRDFTYVDDLVRSIRLLIDVPPRRPEPGEAIEDGDSLSPVAPHRVVNIGNSEPVSLIDFVEAIERALGKKAIRHLVGMQPGDVPATWADTRLLERLTGFRPSTAMADGVSRFADWLTAYRAETASRR